jgi:plasmid stabilization system protein ParE
MNLEIRWSAPALLSLAEVLEYTIVEHGERQAMKMRKQIMSAVKRITLTPKAAPIEPISEKVGFELRGLLVIKKIKVIYSVSDEAINIEYIKNTYLSDKTMLERMGYSL